MANNGRRDGHFGSYPSYNAYQQQPQHQQQQYGQQQNRRGSFDQGDDSNIQGLPPSRQQTYQAYGQNASASQSPDLRSNSYSSSSGTVSAGPQYASQTSYNPASYAQTSPQIGAPASANSHIQMPAGNYAAAHVPYNPAAYSNASPQPGQGGFGYQAYNSPSLAQYSQNSIPPLPPKPPELAQTGGQSYSRPPDRRGAVSTASTPIDNNTSWLTQSPPASYSAYQAPPPPPPPSHTSPGATPNIPSYQAYTPPVAQSQQTAPPPLHHRRLPTIPQGATSPPTEQPGWAPRNSSLSSADAHGRSNSVASAGNRPLPSPPGEGQSNGPTPNEESSYDNIFAEVEAAVMGRPGPASHSRSQSNHRPRQNTNGTASSSRQNSVRDTGQSHSNQVNDETVAAQGMEALRLMNEENAINRNVSTRTTETFLTGTTAVSGDVSRMQSYRSYASTNTFDSAATETPKLEDAESDDDMAIGIDISGGFDPGFGYNAPTSPPPATIVQPPPPAQSPPVTQPLASPPPPTPPQHGRRPSGGPQVQYVWAHSGEELLSPRTIARTDTGGTGGFVEPTAPTVRRMSFDEDDEATLIGYDQHQQSTTSGQMKGNHGPPQRTGSRPLPPTPEDSDHLSPGQAGSRYPQGPGGYESHYEGPEHVRKTNSLNTHNNSQLLVPGRSITDAEQRRKAGYRNSFYNTADSRDPAFAGPELDLPAIPDGRRRKFVPSKLSTKDFALCSEPWAMSQILGWLKEMTAGEADLKEQPLVEALTGLFTHKVPTMNISDAESLGATIVLQLIQDAAILREEEWIKFSDLQVTGVIYQLTGTGCYSPRVHTTTMQGRCYSHHCMRTLKKIDLQAQQLPPEKKAEDWMTFWGMTVEKLKDVDRKEIELQNNLHEIVTSEDYFIDQLDVLLVLYKDGLTKSAQPIIALTGKQGKFVEEVFGKVPAVKKANEDYLIAQLKYRQKEQGPYVSGFSDIFREWIRRAKEAYTEYAYNLPNAILQVKTQVDQNPLFKQFLDQVRDHPRSKRLDWNTYLKAPITRLQRYGLLLETVRKNMRKEEHAKEKANLEIAIREIKEVTLECDAKVAEMTKRTDMQELGTKLKLRPGMEHVQLNLNHLGRSILHRGELMRRSANNMSWVENHVILFDHFMVLSKPTRGAKDNTGTVKADYYDVSKLPIPMDLLVLESADDGMVAKHSVKGIIPIGTAQVSRPTGPPTPDLRLQRTTTGPGGNSMPQAQRANSSPAVTSTGVNGQSDENIVFPFKVQHLGKPEVYVLYAPTAKARSEWTEAIILAKKQHAASLFAQNAEPFRLRVLADTSFAYSLDSPGGLPVHIPGTPLDRAIKESEAMYPRQKQAQPVCRSTVNCATTFTPHLSTQKMHAVGTDFGVFITQDGAPRSWYKAINATGVTQIQVLEDHSVLLIIADKALIAFHLDGVVPPPGANAGDTSKKVPQKLSGSRDVGYFAVGRMKERMLVFYKKRDGISSTFKVLEPVYTKTSTSTSTSSSWGRSRFGLKKGNTDFFRDFDDFYIATDTYAINLFASSLAIASSKGIEVLTLDKKMPFSIPDLRSAEVASIATRLASQKPLGMFRLNESEFLLVFEEVGIYVDKHGDVSRAVVMEFVGRARQAALHKSTYLVLVDSTNGFVEVRNAMNGRLRQVISGRDVKMLDDGMAAGMSTILPHGNGSNGAGSPTGYVAGTSRGTVKISMQHPEVERGYVVLEMLVNEGITD